MDNEEGRWRARLLKEERALYAANEANLIAAIHDLPGRGSALLAVCGVVATLFASAAVIELGPAARNDSLDRWLPWLLLGFLLVMLLVGVAVWLTLGALSPVKFAEFDPDTSFTEEALKDLEPAITAKAEMDASIDDYMADISAIRIQENSRRLRDKHRKVNVAIWFLRFAFVLGIMLFACGVIIKAGGIGATIMRLFRGSLSAAPRENKDQGGGKASGGGTRSTALKSPRSGRTITSGKLVDVTEQKKQ